MLRIELQEGFDQDEVICALDGREVARRSGVGTDLRISRADSIPIDAAPGEHVLGVAVPTQGLDAEVPIRLPDGDAYVAVSVRGGRLDVALLDEPPRYL